MTTVGFQKVGRVKSGYRGLLGVLHSNSFENGNDWTKAGNYTFIKAYSAQFTNNYFIINSTQQINSHSMCLLILAELLYLQRTCVPTDKIPDMNIS